jgi:hypothetical protein
VHRIESPPPSSPSEVGNHIFFVMILTKNTRQKVNCFLDVFALDEIQRY